jgi:hypothetical protein
MPRPSSNDSPVHPQTLDSIRGSSIPTADLNDIDSDRPIVSFPTRKMVVVKLCGITADGGLRPPKFRQTVKEIDVVVPVHLMMIASVTGNGLLNRCVETRAAKLSPLVTELTFGRGCGLLPTVLLID